MGAVSVLFSSFNLHADPYCVFDCHSMLAIWGEQGGKGSLRTPLLTYHDSVCRSLSFSEEALARGGSYSAPSGPPYTVAVTGIPSKSVGICSLSCDDTVQT